MPTKLRTLLTSLLPGSSRGKHNSEIKSKSSRGFKTAGQPLGRNQAWASHEDEISLAAHGSVHLSSVDAGRDYGRAWG